MIRSLRDAARETCHEFGLTWYDPVTGKAYPPPTRKESKMFTPMENRTDSTPGRKPAKFNAALPRYINGTRCHTHPFLFHLARYLKTNQDMTKAGIAEILDVRPQTIRYWENRAAADRRFKLPKKRAEQFAKLFRCPLSDLWIEE